MVQYYYTVYTNVSTNRFDSSTIDAVLYYGPVRYGDNPYTTLSGSDPWFEETAPYSTSNRLTIKSDVALRLVTIPSRAGAYASAAIRLTHDSYLIATSNHAFRTGTATENVRELVACTRVPYATKEEAACA